MTSKNPVGGFAGNDANQDIQTLLRQQGIAGMQNLAGYMPPTTNAALDKASNSGNVGNGYIDPVLLESLFKKDLYDYILHVKNIIVPYSTPILDYFFDVNFVSSLAREIINLWILNDFRIYPEYLEYFDAKKLHFVYSGDHSKQINACLALMDYQTRSVFIDMYHDKGGSSILYENYNYREEVLEQYLYYNQKQIMNKMIDIYHYEKNDASKTNWIYEKIGWITKFCDNHFYLPQEVASFINTMRDREGIIVNPSAVLTRLCFSMACDRSSTNHLFSQIHFSDNAVETFYSLFLVRNAVLRRWFPDIDYQYHRMNTLRSDRFAGGITYEIF